LLGALFAFYQTVRIAGGFEFIRELTTDLIKDGTKIQIGVIATFLYSQANLFILNYYSTPYDVGIYSVALNISNILFFFSLSLETGLYPKIAHSTIKEAIPLVQMATRQMILVTGIAALLVAFFSKYIILLYGGQQFLPATKSLRLLLPGVVVFVFPKIVATLWVRMGWFVPLTVIASATALVSIALNLTFIPLYGAEGAAIASTLTYALSSLIALFLFRRRVSKDLSKLVIPTRDDFLAYRDMIHSVYSKYF
jgi:O-antigen/teichoic acid export membrane protein